MNQDYIYLKDYQKPNFNVLAIELFFNIKDLETIVTSKTQYVRQAPGALVLNGEGFELLSLQIDGRSLNAGEFARNDEHLTIANAPERFTLEVQTRLEPQKNTSLEGLYQSRDIIVTQCEAQGFRKITYFMDRPDVMTSYTVTIEADKQKYPILLSNGDRQWKKDLSNGRHQVQWKDPFKKPCYLFALVAGDLGMIEDTYSTSSGKKVNLEIYASHGKQARCWHAMESLKKSMQWDEVAFGREYDLGLYMIVSIDDFNAGAMENKGLNIFNAKYILADPTTATDLDYELIESVVGHEYFHNWTGNRITCRDWFQLSLKEGLTVFRDQEFSSDVGSRGVKRIDDVVMLRNRQFSEDASPNAHPVRPTKAMAVDNFFTATIYEKGAELIRMMYTMTGKTGFRKGMDRYFELYDGQAVTTDDFVYAISSANNMDWTQFKLWYEQSGTPVVEVNEFYDSSKQEFKLSLRQSCPPTPDQPLKQPFHIPLKFALLNSHGQEIAFTCSQTARDSEGAHLIHLTKPSEEIVFHGISEKPYLSLLRGFSAPINLKREVSDSYLLFLAKHDTDEFTKWESLTTLAAKEFHRIVEADQKGLTPVVNSDFVDAYLQVLKDDSLTAGFKAKMLELPSDEYLIQTVSTFHAESFAKARNLITLSIAKTCQQELLTIYKNLHNQDSDKFNAKVYGQRALKNSALSLLAALETPDVIALIEKQYYESPLMTDKIEALEALNHSQHPAREKALQDFLKNWQHDSLVMDKWFALQAKSSRPDTFAKVKELAQHPQFDFSNPNKVYSLFRNFALVNLCQFHAGEGETYDYYADLILQIDAKNPQVAARVCAAFNPWRQMNTKLQAKAKAALAKILNHESLSKNSREILSRALGN